MTKKILISLVILTLQFKLHAQDFISSVIDLSSLVHDTVYEKAKSNGVMTLDEDNNDFLLVVSLGPLLTLHDDDSAIAAKHRIDLKFTGKFPVSNLSAYDSEYDYTIYSMPGYLTINGITRSYTLNFELQKLISLESNPRDAYGFPARISFSLEFYPVDFGLHITAGTTQKIRVTAATETINRIHQDVSRQHINGNKTRKFSLFGIFRKLKRKQN